MNDAPDQQVGAKTAARLARQNEKLFLAFIDKMSAHASLAETEISQCQSLLKEGSERLLSDFLEAAGQIAALRKKIESEGAGAPSPELADRLKALSDIKELMHSAVRHLQCHDMVNQIQDGMRSRMAATREQLVRVHKTSSEALDAAPGQALESLLRGKLAKESIVTALDEIEANGRQKVSQRGLNEGGVDLF